MATWYSPACDGVVTDRPTLLKEWVDDYKLFKYMLEDSNDFKVIKLGNGRSEEMLATDQT